ncbi:NAD(P)-dependent oxidoreductase [Luteipulveratus mongoliensis]|uniref:NAD(P)-dependent oxidoreductase n=1 Tax=Luteipulveratus mongoliensis TaxID=571913 RepID=UPI001C54E955|nr:NAD(P)-dependent oxidoreductase [Luteipulveratus mongoliensis]
MADKSVIGLLHPGAMGAAVGGCLVDGGRTVIWAAEGRSAESRARAAEAGLKEVDRVEDLLSEASVILSICPPHAALDIAAAAGDFAGTYVDANAVSPETVRRVAAALPRATFVDGGIIGSPPHVGTGTRLYVSGDESAVVRDLFAGTALSVLQVDGGVGSASALKMAYAAWTKGSGALLLAARDLARSHGVEADLLAEWDHSLPQVADRLTRAERSATAKGWRWVGEMDQIAATMRGADLPDGFHVAAADVYRGYPRPEPTLP